MRACNVTDMYGIMHLPYHHHGFKAIGGAMWVDLGLFQV